MVSSRIDHILFITIIILLVLGSIFVFSSSYYQALQQGENTLYYLIGHIKRLLVAVVFFFAGLLIPVEKYRKLILPGFLFILLVLIFTLVIGKMQYGAKRSILISSFGIQISEFVRIWIVLFLANFFTNHPDTARTRSGILVATALPLSLIILVAVQPSISVAIITFLTMISMIIYSDAKLKVLTPVILIGVALFAIAVLTFPHVRHRIFSFISNPAYQVQQSLIAIGSGGILGRGIGAGIQKFLFLPRIHNDFIFAHIAEETGFIGTLIIFILYWEIFLRGLSIAQMVYDEFARLVVMGLNTTIFVIFLVHVGVSIGLLPPTGIPLPFVSYGGWSLCANLFSMGLILQISKMV
ncbi:MAG: FtsW/RodA/SpoVE family cell cycle protein [candidate division WOR-3 bacterium]|nr:FtsW/RodA/SpoVE family cell cycle protein [candidate division WOR-3 bacterium]